MKQLDKIRVFGITTTLMIVIVDILFGIYIKGVFECLLVSWIFNFVVAFAFHFSVKLLDTKSKRDKYKEWADKLNRGE